MAVGVQVAGHVFSLCACGTQLGAMQFTVTLVHLKLRTARCTYRTEMFVRCNCVGAMHIYFMNGISIGNSFFYIILIVYAARFLSRSAFVNFKPENWGKICNSTAYFMLRFYQ